MRLLANSLILSIAMLMAASCAPDSSVVPRSEVLRVPVGPVFTIQETYDACSWDCHANNATGGDDNYYCPTWCHTYPITSALRQRITTAMQHIISDPQCTWARNFLSIVIGNGAMRYYDDDWYGSVGDWHNSRAINDGQGPDYGGRMHLLWGATFDSDYLAQTLVHEAYHGYFNSDNESEAENWALLCTGHF
jgi:hypothetical protein